MWLFEQFTKFFRRCAIRRIVQKLRARAGVQDFLDGFYEGFNWPATIGAIHKAVKDDVIRWEDIGYDEFELEYLYREHVNDILYLLFWSFQTKHTHVWKHSRQAIHGFERFKRFVDQNETVKYREHDRIAALFWKQAFALLRRESPDASDGELHSLICAEQSKFSALPA